MYDINDIPDRPICDHDDLIDHAWPTVPTLKAVKDHWKRLPKEDRRRSTLRYYALCTYADSLFGRIIDKIDKIGQAENTLFVFTSDHGEMLGDRNHRFSKCCLYDGSVRVPLFFAGAGVPEYLKGSVDDKPAELIDILPTLMEAAGVEEDFCLPGVNLLSNRRKPGTFSEYHGQGYEDRQYAPAWMWRTDKFKLILHFPCDAKEAVDNFDNAVGELYDLQNDPLEVNNLYDDIKYQQIKDKLIRQLLLNTMSVSCRFPFPYSTMPFK
jgi:arylsulfatase A-like enzyme